MGVTVGDNISAGWLFHWGQKDSVRLFGRRSNSGVGRLPSLFRVTTRYAHFHDLNKLLFFTAMAQLIFSINTVSIFQASISAPV